MYLSQFDDFLVYSSKLKFLYVLSWRQGIFVDNIYFKKHEFVNNQQWESNNC